MKKGEGKRAINNNINMKLSTYEEMYDYEEGYHELERRYNDDFPTFAVDTRGNPFNPNVDKNGQNDSSAFMKKPEDINSAHHKHSRVHQSSILKTKNNGKL